MLKSLKFAKKRESLKFYAKKHKISKLRNLETFPKLKKKKNSISISVFGYENKEKHPVYVSKKCFEEKHVDLLLIGDEGKRHYALIKDFSTLMYDLTLHREENTLLLLFTSF